MTHAGRRLRRTRGIVPAVALVTFAGVGSARAQDTVRVGHPDLDGSFLEEFSVVWLATRTTPEGDTTTFTVEEEYRVVEGGEGTLYRMTQDWKDSVGSTVFVTVRVADRRTLELRAFHTGRTPGGVAHLDFDDSFVSGFYAPAPEQRLLEFDLLLDEAPLGTSLTAMLAALPLSMDAHLVYPQFTWGGTDNPDVMWREMSVLGRESLRLPVTGEIEAWKVRQGNQTQWLAREAPYLLKVLSTSPDGRETVFEVESWTRDP